MVDINVGTANCESLGTLWHQSAALHHSQNGNTVLAGTAAVWLQEEHVVEGWKPSHKTRPFVLLAALHNSSLAHLWQGQGSLVPEPSIPVRPP
jgi:hypothetical protein